MTTETLARLRSLTLGATGLVCLAYGLMALATSRPDPFHPAIPALMGVASAVLIWLGFARAGRAAARAATDEGFRAENRKAMAIGYWLALGFYPVFGLALASGVVGHPVAFAAMGTFTGAAYLLPVAAFGLRGL